MQVKKDEMLEAILAAAYEQFKIKGFEKASLRIIVKEAGTTIGNFYNYFSNKEALFVALVGEVHHQFMWFIEHHDDLAVDQVSPPEFLDMENREVVLELLATGALEKILRPQIEVLVPFLNERFLLLVDGAYGTKYESFIDDLYGFFHEHLGEMFPKNQTMGDYNRVISHMFVDGLLEIVRSHEERDLVDAIITHFLFFIYGTLGTLGRTVEE